MTAHQPLLDSVLDSWNLSIPNLTDHVAILASITQRPARYITQYPPLIAQRSVAPSRPRAE